MNLRTYNPATERLTREEMLDLQWEKLQHQLEWMYERNSFYRTRLDAAGLKPGDVTSIEAFREQVPFCEKTDLLEDQNAHPPFGQRLGVSEDRVVMTFLTSGTSGAGQEVYGHTWKDALLSGTKYLEGPLWWLGLRKGDRVFMMVPIATLAFGLMVVETMRLAGYQPFQVFNLDSATKLKTMSRFSPHALVLTPTHLARLTTIAQEVDIQPHREYPDLKGILVAGQAYPVELAQRLEEAWGTKLYETYGSSQGNGHMAATCELGAVHADGSRGAMHIYEHHVLLEVLDADTGEHVAPGEEGMAVVTNLEVEGSPLLRFRTNDKVRYLGEECPCGRGWAAIEAGTISRYDDMLKIRGMNIWPQAVDDVVLGHEAVDEYVAEVYVDDSNLEQVGVQYALREDVVDTMDEARRETLREELARRLKERTNVTFQLVEEPRSELPVFEFKALRWTDTRQSDLEKKVW